MNANNPPNEPSPAMNHVFVDFENVHHVDQSVIGRKTVSFMLLLGARQKVQGDLVEKLMQHSASVQLVRLTTSGRNALDFTLAYYVGRAVLTDPAGYFHIISRDTGFDPLIEHLRSRHIHAHRHDDFSTLTFAAPAKPTQAKPSAVEEPAGAIQAIAVPLKLSEKKTVAPPMSLLDRAVTHLRKLATKRPKSKRTLVRDLKSFLKPATETEVLKLVEALQKVGHLTINDKSVVSYSATL